MVTGKDLAELLDVPRSTLSEATKEGRECGGYDVSEWAERYDSGRVKGYDLPEELLEEMAEAEAEAAGDSTAERTNPAENVSSSPEEGNSEGGELGEFLKGLAVLGGVSAGGALLARAIAENSANGRPQGANSRRGRTHRLTPGGNSPRRQQPSTRTV